MCATWAGTLPVYINNFNRLRSTQEMVKYFDSIPGVEAIIVDNASTYEPLLRWYSTECERRKIVRLKENLGSCAPWRCGAVLPAAVHRALFGSQFYAVTDSDLSFQDCPSDLLSVLTSGCDLYPDAVKVGVSLEIDDLPNDAVVGREASAWEHQFWAKRRDERFFEAAVDTTFAVYRADDRGNYPGVCLRSDRPYTARHLPWYLTWSNATEEDKFYLSNAQFGDWTPKLRTAFREHKKDDDGARHDDFRALAATLALTDSDKGRYDPQWAISQGLQSALRAILNSFRPTSILETGPGLSSLLCYRYQHAFPQTEYWSVDHEGPAHDSFLRHIDELGFSAEVALVRRLTDQFYDLSELPFLNKTKFALLLLDGPPASHQRCSQECLEFLRTHSSSDSIFIQDDTHRGEETSVVTSIIGWFGSGHFDRYEIRDPIYTWRQSTILVPRHLRTILGSSSAEIPELSAVAA